MIEHFIVCRATGTSRPNATERVRQTNTDRHVTCRGSPARR
jgi:hypothetical protein